LAQIASIRQGSSLTPDCVEFSHVSPESFHEIEREAGQEGQEIGRFFYLADARFLIVTLTTHPHEQLHRFIFTKIVQQAAVMGLPEELASSGEYKAPGGSKGESDSNFLPRSQRPAPDSWPSVVIEAGYSQTEDSAKAKADWWLRQSNYAVNLVLLIKMEMSQRKIWIEKWKGVSPPVCTGPTTRSRATAPAGPPPAGPPPRQPGRVGNRIVITRRPGITDTYPQRFDPASYNVARGNLRIEFGDLFCRPAQPPQEADIILDTAFLRRFAVSCWGRVHV